MNTSGSHQSDLIAELNDLLQLDHDAVKAYTVAIDNLEAEQYRRTLVEFREDHQRHIADLTRLITNLGGTPATGSHMSSGIFKLIMQQEGRLGGDRGILMAYKTNEGQAREKYKRHAEQVHGGEVDEVIRRNAADEERHYRWAEQTLASLGVEEDSMLGRAQQAAEAMQGTMADVLEGAAREATKVADRVKRKR